MSSSLIKGETEKIALQLKKIHHFSKMFSLQWFLLIKIIWSFIFITKVANLQKSATSDFGRWQAFIWFYLFVLSVVKTALKHSIYDGLQSWVNLLLLFMAAVDVSDSLLGVEVYTFGCQMNHSNILNDHLTVNSLFYENTYSTVLQQIARISNSEYEIFIIVLFSLRMSEK